MVRGLKNLSQENTRVVSFSIQPLRDFCKDSERILVELYADDMRKVAKMRDDFNSLQQYLNKLKSAQFPRDYPSYNNLLLDLGTPLVVLRIAVPNILFFPKTSLPAKRYMECNHKL